MSRKKGYDCPDGSTPPDDAEAEVFCENVAIHEMSFQDAYCATRNISKSDSARVMSSRWANYYKNRIQYLIELKECLPPNRYMILNSEDLVENTESTLSEISRFLQLSTPLRSKYELFDFTGIHGDPDKNIKKGTVIKNMEKPKKSTSKYNEEYSLFRKLIDQ